MARGQAEADLTDLERRVKHLEENTHECYQEERISSLTLTLQAGAVTEARLDERLKAASLGVEEVKRARNAIWAMVFTVVLALLGATGGAVWFFGGLDARVKRIEEDVARLSPSRVSITVPAERPR